MSPRRTRLDAPDGPDTVARLRAAEAAPPGRIRARAAGLSRSGCEDQGGHLHATSYVITYRAADDPARRANLEAVLGWLTLQPLAEVVVIEQDVAPTLGDLALSPNAHALFAYNPGPFNKSWGFNMGIRASRGSVLAFGDADVLCRALPTAVAAARSGAPVVRAFSTAIDLDEAESEMLRADLSCLGDPSFGADARDRTQSGETPPLCGGLVLFQRPFLALLGGWDERFVGWGGEDNAMDIKIKRAGLRAAIVRESPGFHLAHRRAVADIATDPHYRNNLALLRQLREMPEEALRRMCEVTMQLAGNPDMHRPMEGLE